MAEEVNPKRAKRRKKSRLPETRTQGRPVPLRTPGRVELEYREGSGHLWPESLGMPGSWRVRSPVPCPKCRRVYLTQATQAVIAKSVDRNAVGGGIAYLECRGCGNRFKLPIEMM